ncbi:MAG: zinc ribbon domain-containing protein [Deltaproteobacteria bacterium]|nr:MAG: zinc ribbon domain-containing protein [Deltaproteobacteria bacterium]
MPIYEYKCEQCGHSFEKLVFAGDREKIICPKCGAPKTKKLMSCASFMGSGIGSTCADRPTGGFS